MKSSDFPNMLTFARTYLFPFEEKPFCEVDSLIFSWLSYLYIHEEIAVNFSPKGMPISNLLKAEYFEEMFHKIWSVDETFDLLVAVIASPRYRNIRLRYYRFETDPRISLQFSAVVFSISDQYHYVAYRGTDWYLTGWKEDLLLALTDPVPAQKMAVSYLNSIGEVLDGDLIVGGHSKGGNLAVFAAAHCDRQIQDRILTVYSHDGPGFLKEELSDEGFARIHNRIQKTIPYASYFGILFESETNLRTVKSNGKSILQHNPMSWMVKDDHLVLTNNQSKAAHITIRKLNHWINSMSNAQRIMFIETLFQVLDELGLDSIDELSGNLHRYIPMMIKAMNHLDKERRQYLLYALRIALLGGKPDQQKLQAFSDIDDIRITSGDDEDLASFNQEYEMFISSVNPSN